jgi:uncharacterized repeat protein (TIGR01451 family)
MKNLYLLLALLATQFLIAQNDSLVNGDFESGDFTGWELFEGAVNANPFEMINIVSVTPPSSQHAINSVSNDPVVGTALPRVCPNGGFYSVELGDGTGTGGLASRIKQTFLVDSIDNALAYHFSLVMESPDAHYVGEMPFFSARVVDQNGDTIYNKEILPLDANSGGDSDFIAYSAGVYLPWKTNYVDLSGYVGEYVTLEFTSGDCAQSGHYAYAYVEAESIVPTPCMFLDFTFDSIQNVTCAQQGYLSSFINDGIPPYNYMWNTGETTSYIEPLVRGIYGVSITDSAGCNISKSVFVNGPEYIADFDYGVNLSNGVFRPGQLTTLFLDVFNKGCMDTTGQLYFVFDDLTSLNYVSLAPDSIFGDTLMWNLAGLIDSNFSPYIGILTDTSANIGDTLCFDIFVTPTLNDVDTSNNYLHYCTAVVNSYDPNYKEVFPKGKCNPNYVLNNQRLTYVVHFQNTGTASAINVHVMDTLNALLDINSLKVVGQSHSDLITEVINGNILDFQFDNINLPSSGFQEIDSHGYVMFEIEPISGILDNSLIENKVGIYFDYNEPIITNTVFNTFVDSIPHQETILNETTTISYELNGVVYDSSGTYTQEFYSVVGCDSVVILNLTVTPTGVQDIYRGDEVVLYPNPISSILNVGGLNEVKDYEIIIYNTLGEVVFNGVNSTEVNLSNLPQGVYSFRLKTGNTILTKKIVKQ